MERTELGPAPTCQRVVLCLFLLLVFVGLIAFNPIALIPPALSPGQPFKFALPISLATATVAGMVVFGFRFHCPRWLAIATIAFVLVLGLHALIRPSAVVPTLKLLAFVTVPLATALCLLAKPEAQRWLVIGLAAVWFVQVIYCVQYVFLGVELQGTVGNRNWLATAVLAALPWNVYLITKCSQKLSRAVRLVLLLLITASTFYVLIRVDSRAAWLILMLWGGLAMVHLVPTRHSLAMTVAVAIGLLCIALATRSGRIQQAAQLDMRPPTWRSTAALIIDYPLLGVGPGEFSKAYAPYRDRSDYANRPNVADLTVHPHNEWLAVAASCGLPAAVAWLCLFLPLWRRPNDAFERAAMFSLIAVFFHGMLDRTHSVQPTALMAMVTLGFLYRRDLSVQAWRGGTWTWPYRCVCVAVLGGLLVGLAHEIQVEWHFRRAREYADHRQYDVAIQHYRRVIVLEPDNVRAHYAAGALAIQKLARPDMALELLGKAAQLDPNYARINGFIGKSLGVLGAHDRALPFFAKDYQRFPRRIPGLQSYILCLERNHRFDELNPLMARLDELYSESTRFPLSEERKRASDWLNAVKNDDVTQAMYAAGYLLRNVPYEFSDPMTSRLTNWPPKFLYLRGFTAWDVEYWHMLVRREQLRAALPPEASRDGIACLGLLLKETLKDVSVTPSLGRYMTPNQIWQQRTADPLSVLAMLAWLAADHDLLLLPDADAGPALLHGQMVVRVDWTAASIKTEPLEQASSERPYYLVYPQELLYRNRALALVVQHGSADIQLLREPPPSVALAKSAATASALGHDLAPHEMAWPVPFAQAPNKE